MRNTPRANNIAIASIVKMVPTIFQIMTAVAGIDNNTISIITNSNIASP